MYQDRSGLRPVLDKPKYWLSPPMFEGDEEKTRIAGLANTIALAVAVILGIYTFARPKLFQQNAEAAIANAILLLLLISQRIVIRRGRVRLAALIMTSGSWINLTVIGEIDFLTNRFINVNDVISEYLGYNREELLSLSPLDILAEDSRNKFRARTTELLAGKTLPETVEHQVVTRSGRLLWMLVNIRVVFENGRPARATVVAHNIGFRRRIHDPILCLGSQRFVKPDRAKILFEQEIS